MTTDSDNTCNSHLRCNKKKIRRITGIVETTRYDQQRPDLTKKRETQKKIVHEKLHFTRQTLAIITVLYNKQYHQAIESITLKLLTTLSYNRTNSTKIRRIERT